MIELITNADVKLTPDELGRAFAGSLSEDQADFLEEAVNLCADYDWCKQSLMIAQSIENKQHVIYFLETLLGHLKEPEQ